MKVDILHHKIITRICLWLGLFIITIMPFFLCSPLPLGDYSNHLARMHIIAHISDSPYLSQYYKIEWNLLPNLAMDLLVPALSKIMSVETATVLFTGLALLLISTGAIAVHWVLFRNYSLFPFAVFLLLYNRHFLWGFLNYLFAVGLCLWVFTAWIYLRKRNVVFHLLLFNLLSSILFISHLHAFGIYCILVSGYELSQAWPRLRSNIASGLRDLALGAGQFALPLLLFFLISKTNKGSYNFKYPPFFNKLIGLLDGFNNYNVYLDVATFCLLSLIFLIGLLTARIVIHRMMILSIILLTVLYFLMPDQMFFNTYGADRRLVFVVFMILVASSEWEIDSARWRAVLITTFLALFVTRMGVIAINWHRANKIYQEHIKVIDLIGKGDRMAAAVGILRMPFLGNPPVANIPSLAVIRRDAFVNSLFAEPGQQVLRILYNTDTQFYKSSSQQYDVDNTKLSGSQLISPINIYETIPLDRFDYLLVINQRFFPYKPPTFLIPVYRADKIDTILFRIDKHLVKQD